MLLNKPQKTIQHSSQEFNFTILSNKGYPWLRSVSYTHLDVYKRQHVASLISHMLFSLVVKFGVEIIANGAHLQSHSIAVSYTHLDVYKRQV